MGPLTLMPFLSAFKTMDKLVSSWFYSKSIDPDVGKCITELKIAFKGT